MNNTQYQNINFRMNKDIKKQFDSILEEIGLNPSTAFNMFARLVVRENGLPFPITIKKENPASVKTKIIKADKEKSFAAIKGILSGHEIDLGKEREERILSK